MRVFILVIFLAGCASKADFIVPPYRQHIELVLMVDRYTGERNLPYPSETIERIIERAGAAIEAESDYRVSLVPANTPRSDEARRCFVNFTTTGTGRYSPYVPDEWAGRYFIDAGGNCTIWFRSADISSEAYLLNAITHEVWHTIMGTYHSRDPESIMWGGSLGEGRRSLTERDREYLRAIAP